MASRDYVRNEILETARTTPALEIGYDKNLGGRPAVSLTNPIPRMNVITVPIPNMKTKSSFENVVTKSAIPTVTGMGAEPGGGTTNVFMCGCCGQQHEEKPPPLPEPIPIPVNKNPKGYSDQEMNEKIFDVLMSNGPEISCACDASDYYTMTNPFEGKYEWESGMNVVYRNNKQLRDLEDEDTSDRVGIDGKENDTANSEWVTGTELYIKWSRWGPKDNGGTTGNLTHLLMIHDALDSRKSWWCTQKILSPFMDTVSVDLLGSGDSLLPRAIKIPDTNPDKTKGSRSKDGKIKKDAYMVEGKFPWSFDFHARYLVNMAKVLWPGENFYVAGCGWGAQIAASMASITSKIEGFIMLSPIGFSQTPLSQSFTPYSALLEMQKLTSDEELEAVGSQFISAVNNALLANFGSRSGSNATLSTMKLILDQYSNFDRRRVLIDQLVALDELPFQEFPVTEDNPSGLQIQNIKDECLVISAEHDAFYPAEHRHLYSAVYYHAKTSTSLIRDCGHFIYLEKPSILAETILNFIRFNDGFEGLDDAYIGFVGSNQGNEKTIITALRQIYF